MTPPPQAGRPRIGLVSYWLNRGQAVVSRQLRASFEARGHATFVLARPTKDNFVHPGHVAERDVWNQPHVTHASQADIPWLEYERWVKDHHIDVACFDQNYQFDEIAKLRALGVRTVGRFVWETFAEHHVAAAREAFDVIYSFTRCEQARYASFGIESPRVRFGCSPELVKRPTPRRREHFSFFYPGGFLSRRKPTGAVIEAFLAVRNPDARLLIKTQQPLRTTDLIRADVHQDVKKRKKFYPFFKRLKGDPSRVAELDPRIQVVDDDLDLERYDSLFESCHVCLGPARWEGLGLHLYEATAFGMPIVANDMPPLNEVVRDGETGLLSRSRRIGQTKSGIDSHEPDVADLTRAMEAICEPTLYDRLAQNTRDARERLSWDQTVADFLPLLEG